MTYNYSDISLQEYPGEVSLLLYTGKCNLRCPWCYNSSLYNKKQLSYKQMKDAIDEHRDFITAVVITGGEPLYNNFLRKILKYSLDNGLKTKLNTNGLVPNHFRKNTFTPYVDYVNISLKGLPQDYKDILKDKSDWTWTIHCETLEYSFVYSPSLWPKKKLENFHTFLKQIISYDWRTMFSNRWSQPDIFTISQIKTGECMNKQYNDCSIPTKQECINVAKMFSDIPRKKTIVETKEYGRIII